MMWSRTPIMLALLSLVPTPVHGQDAHTLAANVRCVAIVDEFPPSCVSESSFYRASEPPLPESLVVSSAASRWRGTWIGAAIGFVASVIAWQLIQEEDDDSLLNGYATAIGVVGGGLIGLGIAIAF